MDIRKGFRNLRRDEQGIGLAKGAIIGMINSDDWYEQHALEMVANSFREHGNGVYYGILRVMKMARK